MSGLPVMAGSRALEVLLVLAERAGRLVSKAELLDVAWAGLVVEENNVSVQIAALRKAIGAKEIATVPGIGYRLMSEPLRDEPDEDAGSARAPGAAAPSPARPGALALIGRETELDDLAARLRDAPLISIVGTGGVGKTSLARELLARSDARDIESIHWIDLAPIQEPRDVVPLVAKALGVEIEPTPHAADELHSALGEMAGLVALDNCEHLLEEVAGFVRSALARAPGMRWLTTSQEPLHIPGEFVFRLEPLAVPPAGATVAQALEYGAVALLCQRAAAADPGFRLDERNLAPALDLCAQLDGVPLAIEMAAARVATFGLEEVRQRLCQRLRLLTGRRDTRYRHDTLQGTFDWSYGLLSEVEKAVFRRLEPFLGGFRIDMAQQVVSDPAAAGAQGIDAWQALDAVSRLVEKSLVQRSADAPGRFHLFESARDYARSCLEVTGESSKVRQRHAHATATLFAHAQVDADRMTDAEWTLRYAPERHNVGAALAWACEACAPDDLARLVAALAMIDSFLSRRAEILRFDIPLDVLAQAEPALRAAAYLELSWANYLDGDRAFGAMLAQEAFETFASRGDDARAYRALAQLTRLHEARPGMAASAEQAWNRLQELDDRPVPLRTRLFCRIAAGMLHRRELTVAHMQEFERLARGAGFDGLAMICKANITDKMLIAGHCEDVIAIATQDSGTEADLPRARAAIAHNHALALIRLGRTEEAYAPARAAFKAMPSAAHFLIDSFALAAAREGRFTDAAILSGCGTRVRQERNEKPDLAEEAAIVETAERLERALSPVQRTDLMRLGAAMSAVEALTIKVFPRGRPDRATDNAAASAPDRTSSLDVG